VSGDAVPTDPEVLSTVQLGLQDESLLCEDGVWLHRVANVLLSVKGEHSDKPRFIFYKEYDTSAIAQEALNYLRLGAERKSVETISRESEWQSIVKALE
jgi:hypothetical protein